jgi:hypothetical protein
MGLSKEHKAEMEALITKHAEIFRIAKENGEKMLPYVESMLDEGEILRQKYIDEQWQEDDERLTKLRLQKEAEGKKLKGYDLDTFEPIYED